MRSHTGEKPYQCCLCDEVFLNKGVLDQHMITHTGRNHINIVFMKKAFVDKSKLNLHIRTDTRKIYFIVVNVSFFCREEES